MHLFTDFGFKRAFGTASNKRFLISFLNALLGEKDQIVDITYRNVEKMGFSPQDRAAIYDLYCTTESGAHIIVEMQNAYQRYFMDRSIFYSTFPMHEEAKRGAWDFKLPKIFTVAFLNFRMNEYVDSPAYKHVVKLADVDTHQVFYDKLTYIYLELPKFEKQEEALETAEDIWLYILKNLHLLDAMPSRIQGKIYRDFFRMAEIHAMSPAEAEAYEESLKHMRDYNNTIKSAEEKGMAKGEALGMAKGEAKTRIEIARNFKSAGFPLEDIAKATGLSLDTIAEL